MLIILLRYSRKTQQFANFISTSDRVSINGDGSGCRVKTLSNYVVVLNHITVWETFVCIKKYLLVAFFQIWILLFCLDIAIDRVQKITDTDAIGSIIRNNKQLTFLDCRGMIKIRFLLSSFFYETVITMFRFFPVEWNNDWKCIETQFHVVEYNYSW